MNLPLDQTDRAGAKRGRLQRLRGAVRLLFWTTIFGVCALAVGCVAWVMYWESRVGGDNAATIMQASELVSDAQRSFAAEPNRWDHVEALFTDYQDLQDRFRKGHPAPGSSEGLSNRDWTPDASMGNDPKSSPSERETGAAFLDALVNSGLLARQDLFTQSRHFERPITAQRLLDASYLDLILARRLARADRALLIRHWQQGGAEDLEAAKAFEWTLALGRIYRYQFGSINSLVGIAIQAMALNIIREVCVLRPLKEEALAYCLRAMDRQMDAPGGDFALLSERLLVLDTVQWSFTDDGRGDGSFLASENLDFGFLTGGKARRTATGEGFFLVGKKELTAKFEETLAPDLERAKKLPRDRTQEPARDVIDELSWRFRILKILAPALNKVIAANDQLLGEIAGTKAMLAIELYRARNSRLPASLSELVPEYLATEPLDPLAPGSLRYRLIDAATDPLGRSYILYTVGVDRVDNDGRINEKAPYTSMNGSSAGAGFDFVFNVIEPDFREYLVKSPWQK